MESGEQKTTPRRARTTDPYGAGYGVHSRVKSRSRRDPRPSLLGAGARTGDPASSPSRSRPASTGRAATSSRSAASMWSRPPG